MTAKKLKSNHPELWGLIEDTVKCEMEACAEHMVRPSPERIRDCVAHNTAFAATYWCERKCPLKVSIPKSVFLEMDKKAKGLKKLRLKFIKRLSEPMK